MRARYFQRKENETWQQLTDFSKLFYSLCDSHNAMHLVHDLIVFPLLEQHIEVIL